MLLKIGYLKIKMPCKNTLVTFVLHMLFFNILKLLLFLIVAVQLNPEIVSSW